MTETNDHCGNLIKAYEQNCDAFATLCNDELQNQTDHCRSLRQTIGKLAKAISHDCPDYFKLNKNRLGELARKIGINLEDG